MKTMITLFENYNFLQHNLHCIFLEYLILT